MSKKYSIKCTNCASPLTLLGGGRVEIITCSYCKSVLDLNDNYRVLSNFKEVKEKYSIPFDLGMRGEIKGVEYTIIGRVTYREDEPPFEEWSELLLFSPLYGYAWLTYEQGHLLFSKRNRKMPLLDWDNRFNVGSIEIEGEYYQPFSMYSAKIIYVEGELTWVAKKGDSTSFIDFIAPPYGLSAEKSNDEIEYYRSEYLNADEVYKAFSVESEKVEEPNKFNVLKPFSKPFYKSLSKVAKWALLIWFFLFLAFYFDGTGKKIESFEIKSEVMKRIDFTISSEAYLSTIYLRTQNSKTLNNFNLKLYKENKLLFSSSSSKAYLFDMKTGAIAKEIESWERKAKEIKIYLNLEKGLYQLDISKIDKSINSPLYIAVYEKVVRMNYLTTLFLLLLFSFFLYWFMKLLYHSKIKEEGALYGGEYNNLPFEMSNIIFGVIFITFIILMIIITT